MKRNFTSRILSYSLAVLVLSLSVCSPIALNASSRTAAKRSRSLDVSELLVTVGPTDITFPIQSLGTTSYSVSVILSNFNYLAVAVSSIAVSGDFLQTNNCGSSVAGESSCTIQLNFLPSAAGVRTGTLAITDDANGSPHTVGLSGVSEPAGTGITTTVATANGQAGLFNITGVVTETYGAANPTGILTFLDTTNNDAVLGTASLQAGVSGQNLVNGPSSATGGEQVSAVSADFNGDGKADLAILNNAGQGCYASVQPSISILLGNGDGTFTATSSPSGAELCADNLVVADFNGDGKPDIAVASNGAGFTLLLGNGDGTFLTQNVTLPSASYANVVTGDFNGDGKLDLAFLNLSSNAEIILLGNGDGSFTTSSVNPPAAPNAELSAIGDFNGDGRLDLATIGAQPSANGGAFNDTTISVSLGNGDGTFQPSMNTDVGNALLPAASFQDVGVGDFNGDGKSDIAIEGAIVNGSTTSSDGVLMLLSQGEGTFVAAPPIAITPSPQCTQDQPCNQSSNSGSIAVADFNSDGNADVAVLTDDVVQILLSNGQNGFRTGAATVDSGAETDPDYLALTIGDFNGDGVPDFAFTESDASTVTLSLGERTESASATLPSVEITGVGDHYLEAVYPGSSSYVPSTSPLIAVEAYPIPLAQVMPGSIAFTSQALNTTSGAKTVTLSNSGTIPLQLTSIATTGPFTQTNTCGKSLAAGSKCAISIVFSPEAAGSSNGTLLITDNASSSSQSVALNGQGIAVPLAVIAPTTLTFPSQPVDSKSNAETLTLSNPGSAALNVSSVSASAGFTETNTCGAEIAPETSCSISVTFDPTVAGAAIGTLTVQSNAAGSPLATTLTGEGGVVSVSSNVSSLGILSAGGDATAMLQIAPVGGFTGVVDVACAVRYLGEGTTTDLPTCSVSPSQAQIIGTSPVSAMLSVSTTISSSSSLKNGPLDFIGTSIAMLACIGFFPCRRSKARSFIIMLVLIPAGLFGCGGNSGGSSGTVSSDSGSTPGTYQIVVTIASGAPVSSVTIPLTLR